MSALPAACTCGAVALALIYCSQRGKNREDSQCSIPKATPSLPIIGHALYYKSDPPAFLQQQFDKHGPVFELNLAGFKTVILCDEEALRQFALAPEKDISSTQATADFGFKQTLGALNTFVGVAVHRRILSGIVVLPPHVAPSPLGTQDAP